MNIEKILQDCIREALKAAFDVEETTITLQLTKKEFEGTYTFVVFPYVKSLRKSPVEIGNALGNALVEKAADVVKGFNVVQGFLNIVIAENVWFDVFKSIAEDASFGTLTAKEETVMVEYSSPNTNKPLHLGHLRNNFLGFSVAQILDANGYNVVKANLVNDRGIHICKSMLAYQKFGAEETPESSGIKGDHLVGKYYVEFDKKYKEQVNDILKSVSDDVVLDSYFPSDVKSQIISIREKIARNEAILKTIVTELTFDDSAFGFRAEMAIESAGDGNIKWSQIFKCFEDEEYQEWDKKVLKEKKEELADILESVIDRESSLEHSEKELSELVKKQAPLLIEAQEMLLKWEQGDETVVSLWKKMNDWVFEGFAKTYQTMGVSFEKTYKESETYLLGKDTVTEGLASGVFYQKEDGSVWIDLTDEGLDQKLVLRKDGTSVYITQDMGTADLKFKDFQISKSIYVVGNEQDYHFEVLFKILKKLGRPYAEGCYHLSYGMVDLPSGKMKSREGTVVDADDLMQEMVDTARERTNELGKIDGFTPEEATILYRTLAMGALKYFLLKVDPKKRMLFNPTESIDFQGNTGPFIQYTYARICSILRKAAQNGVEVTGASSYASLHEAEQEVIFLLSQYPVKVAEAGREYSPSVIAQYVYDLAKAYNRFYNEVNIFNEPDTEALQFRISFSAVVGETIKKAMALLGIDVPSRM